MGALGGRRPRLRGCGGLPGPGRASGSRGILTASSSRLRLRADGARHLHGVELREGSGVPPAQAVSLPGPGDPAVEAGNGQERCMRHPP